MCDRLGLIVCGDSPGLHNRVIAAGKDDSVAPINVAWGAVGQTGQQNRQSAGFGDGTSAIWRGTMTIVADIARNTDDGQKHGPWRNIGSIQGERCRGNAKKIADRFHDGGGNVGRVPVGD